MSLLACTSAARHQLPQARALSRSLRLLNPPVSLSVLLIDDRDFQIEPAHEPFSVVRPHELDIGRFEILAGIHALPELVDVVRPSLLRLLLDRSDGPVLSLDVDAFAFDSLAQLAAVASRHSVVLVPRLLAAVPDDRLRLPDHEILKRGVFDQDLCAMSSNEDVDRFLRLWSDRLELDLADEAPLAASRLLDLVPGLIGSCAILRDPGLGVSVTNLHERRITREPAYLANGRPLRLVHLNGLDGYQRALDDRLGVGPGSAEPGEGDELRQAAVRRQALQRDLVKDNPSLAELVVEPSRLSGSHVDAEGPQEYAYARLADGTVLTRRLRRAIQDADLHGALKDSPFSAAGTFSLLAWCNAPAQPGDVGGVSRFWHEIYLERTDLQSTFPDLDGGGATHFRRWIVETGRLNYHVPADLVPAMALS